MTIPNRSLLFVIPLAVTAAPLIIAPVVIAIDTGRLADGWNDIIRLPHLRRESLRLNLAEIARRSYGDGATANRVQSDLTGKVNPGTVRVPFRRDAQCCSASTPKN